MKNKKRKGYTLIEILVVVMILGILAYSASPLYNKLIRRTDVADALHNIEMLSEAQSKYFIENNRYTDKLSKLETPLKTNGDDISTTNFTYSTGDVSEGNYCIYAQSNSRDYTLAKNYRSHSEILCSGRDCGDISSIVKEGSISDLCNGTFNEGECDLVCDEPKILNKKACKCVCPDIPCGENKIMNPETCACKCTPEKEAACGASLNLEDCTCKEEPIQSTCANTVCDTGYSPDPNDNCACKCSLTQESCSESEELKDCSCKCKQKLIDACDLPNYTLDEDCQCVCGISAENCNARGENWTLLENCKCGCKKTLNCGTGKTFNPETCDCEDLGGCEPGTIEQTASGYGDSCTNDENYAINIIDGDWGNDSTKSCTVIINKKQLCNENREWDIELTCAPMYGYCIENGRELNVANCECV